MTRVIGPKKSKRRRWTFLSALSIAVGLSILFIPGAFAVHDLGLFELDTATINGQVTGAANVADDSGTPGDDWSTIFAGTSTTAVTSNFTNDGVSPAAPGENLDTSYFTGGGTKDTLDLNSTCGKSVQGWQSTSNDEAPDKDEITNAFAAGYKYVNASSTQNNHFIIYFGLDRFDNSGDSQVGFWFFKSDVSVNSDGTFSGCHSVGDLLILTDFVTGGRIGAANVYEWVGGKNPLSLVESPSSADCSVASTPDNFCAVINNIPGETPPWSYEDKSGNNSYLTGELFEGGVDVTHILGGTVGCFSTFLAETRSSASTTAQLKDYALGSFNTCTVSMATTSSSQSTTLVPGSSVSDTASLTPSSALGGTPPDPTGTIDFYLCQPTDVTSAGCPSGSGDKVGATKTLGSGGCTAASCASDATTNTTAVGKYCWRAVYTAASGSPYPDTEHTNATTECFTTVAQPNTISTRQFVYPQDKARIAAPAGQTTLDGSVTFKMYDTSANCTANGATGLLYSEGPLSIASGSSSPQTKTTSNTTVPISSGTTVYWRVSYSSNDLSQTGALSNCTESTTVSYSGNDTTNITTVP